MKDSGVPLPPPLIHTAAPALLAEERLQLKLRKLSNLLRKTQLELEEVREEFNDLYEHTPVGFLTVDHDGVIEKLNLTAAAILGESRDQLRRTSLTRFIAEESIDDWQKHFRAIISRDCMKSCELVLKRNLEKRFHARLDCLRLCKTAEHPTVRIVLTDITARKLAEIALHEKFDELQRWHGVVIGRETRIVELKREVNELLVTSGKQPRYPSVVIVNNNDFHSHDNTPPQG